MEETVNGGAKFCENCGAPIQPGQKFCDNCGQKIVYIETSAAAPAPAEEPQEQAQGFPEEPQEQEQAQGFPEEPQEQNTQQGSAFQQNSFQQNTQQGAGRQSSNAVLPPRLGCVIAYLFSMLGCIALFLLLRNVRLAELLGGTIVR